MVTLAKLGNSIGRAETARNPARACCTMILSLGLVVESVRRAFSAHPATYPRLLPSTIFSTYLICTTNVFTILRNIILHNIPCYDYLPIGVVCYDIMNNPISLTLTYHQVFIFFCYYISLSHLILYHMLRFLLSSEMSFSISSEPFPPLYHHTNLDIY